MLPACLPACSKTQLTRHYGCALIFNKQPGLAKKKKKEFRKKRGRRGPFPFYVSSPFGKRGGRGGFLLASRLYEISWLSRKKLSRKAMKKRKQRERERNDKGADNSKIFPTVDGMTENLLLLQDISARKGTGRRKKLRTKNPQTLPRPGNATQPKIRPIYPAFLLPLRNPVLLGGRRFCSIPCLADYQE